MKLNKNRFINEGARMMTMSCFPKKSQRDPDLGPRTLKVDFVHDIVILKSFAKLNQNGYINETARMMTILFFYKSQCDLCPTVIKVKL